MTNVPFGWVISTTVCNGGLVEMRSRENKGRGGLNNKALPVKSFKTIWQKCDGWWQKERHEI